MKPYRDPQRAAFVHPSSSPSKSPGLPRHALFSSTEDPRCHRRRLPEGSQSCVNDKPDFRAQVRQTSKEREHNVL